MSGALQRLRANAVEVVSTLVTGIWLAALFLDQEWWLAAMLVGYVVVVPITKIAVGETDDEEYDEWSDSDHAAGQRSRSGDRDDATDEALEELRQRYARGELTEEQFERKLERLLEVETVEDAEEYAQGTVDPKRERATERESE